MRPTIARGPLTMPRDLRAFVDALEADGRLRRITKSVDPAWEPGSLVKWMFQALPDDERFAMLFENVQGSSIPLLTAAIGASPATFARALGVTPDGITAALTAALAGGIAPRVDRDGVCQEVVRRGSDAAIGLLPIPTWTPGKDVAPYITTMVVTKHAQTGKQNTGVYRTQVLDDQRVVINLSPNRQGTRNVRTFRWRSDGADRLGDRRRAGGLHRRGREPRVRA